MLQSLLHRDSSSRVQINQLQTQIQWSLIKVLEVAFRVHSSELRESMLEIRKFVWIKTIIQIFGHSLGVGVPWNWKILNIWSISESPLNNALFYTNSAKIQPTAHVSTPKEYCFCPSNTSGALYQRVSISWVRVLIGIPNALANPKSAIFKFPFLSIKRFWGLRSLWMILLEWQ